VHVEIGVQICAAIESHQALDVVEARGSMCAPGRNTRTHVEVARSRIFCAHKLRLYFRRELFLIAHRPSHARAATHVQRHLGVRGVIPHDASPHSRDARRGSNECHGRGKRGMVRDGNRLRTRLRRMSGPARVTNSSPARSRRSQTAQIGRGGADTGRTGCRFPHR
jgi:hypothetical protein